MAEERTINGWVMTGVGEPFDNRSLPCPPIGPGDALVEVAGCGVCHTDISFLHFGVKTRADLPLVLGHEISGTVIEVGDGVDASLVGRPVLIPAVLPCGECELCKSDNRRICRAQVMPGNDRHGGFASHTVLPAKYMAPIDDAVLAKNELWELSVVADAITTPYQAVRLSGLEEGHLAVFIGAGGIGIHGVQIAAAVGAKVVAMDIDPAKLDLADAHGAHGTLNTKDLSPKEIKTQLKGICKEIGAPRALWRIFETSGTGIGQQIGYSLLGFGAKLAMVGFTMDKVEVRLSNLMAFDAQVTGNWGCDPLLYPDVLRWIADGKIQVTPFVEKHPLTDINGVFDAAHAGKLLKRAVLVP